MSSILSSQNAETPAKLQTSSNKSKKRTAETELQKNNKTIPCPYADCETVFSFSSQLKKHLTNKHNEDAQLRVCDIVNPNTQIVCGKSFKSRDSFNQHKRQAHGEKKFRCDTLNVDGSTCIQTFTTSAALSQHKVIHNVNVQKVRCEMLRPDGSLCGTEFKRTGDLTQHKKDVHQVGGVVLLKCDHPGCDVQCKSVKTLNSHKAFKHNENAKALYCDIPGCSRELPFKTSNHLKRHKAYKHNVNVQYITCEYCSDQFKEASTMRQHMRSCHPDNQSELASNSVPTL